MEIFTIGHSTLSLREFIDLLIKYNIEMVVDVRRFPTSKKFPHFKMEILKEELGKHKISYIWLGEKLGGFRKGGYRNYVETKDFKSGIKELLENLKGRTVIMCAEKLWFKCHRRFIADELVKKGIKVIHIIDKKRTYEHRKSN